MTELDTTKSTSDPSDELGYDEWDGLLITEWFEADPGAPVPASSRFGEFEFAHENPAAWSFVDLKQLGMSETTAKEILSQEARFAELFGAEARMNPYHSKTDGKFTSKGGGAGAAVMDRPPRITAAEGARGNSRPVSEEEFDRIADKGLGMLAQRQRNSAPIHGLDEHWDAIKGDTFEAAQQSWGGATIDAHTGKALMSNADKYALTIKPPGVNTISISERATRQEFDSAMNRAREKFRPVLETKGAHLGVFHDDDLSRIDIDPVLVVSTLGEVEAIGAATHAIGGAYHFASGDGFWPPHVADTARMRKVKLGDKVEWLGIGEWHSYAQAVQRSNEDRSLPFGSRHQRAGDVGAARFNPNHSKQDGKFTSGSGGGFGAFTKSTETAKWGASYVEARVWSTSDGHKITSVDSKFPDSLVEGEIIPRLSELHAKNPLPAGQKLNVSIEPAVFHEGSLAWGVTMRGTATMKLHGGELGTTRLIDPEVESGHLVPAAKGHTELQFVLTHEWGHVIDRPKNAATSQEFYEVSGESARVSKYANKSKYEAFAENFAEFYLSGGKTDSDDALTYAEVFGWRS